MSDRGHLSEHAASGRYIAETEVEVSITVRNPDALERVVGPEGDEWRAQFYKLFTVDDVIEHWIYNALINGILDISRLEGWADLDLTAVDISVEHASLDIRAAS